MLTRQVVGNHLHLHNKRIWRSFFISNTGVLSIAGHLWKSLNAKCTNHFIMFELLVPRRRGKLPYDIDYYNKKF